MNLLAAVNACFQNVFVRNLEIKTHKESVHEGVKYKCSECNYQATERGSLKKHRESVHEGVKNSWRIRS